MQTYRFDTMNRLEGLNLHEEPVPEPQRGEILLKVKAVSLNYRDVAVVLGRYVRGAAEGLVPTSDAACEVVKTGEGVARFKPGDRVLSTFNPRWFGGKPPESIFDDNYGSGQDGWLTEYKVVSEEAVIPMPDSLSWQQGATLPCAAVTAWVGLNGPRPIEPGMSVLTLGTGGVSLFTVQIAKALGAHVISTTSSPQKAQFLKQLGADEVVNYKENPDWAQNIRKLTDDRGVDRIIDVGGVATMKQSIKAVKWGGEVVMVGFLSDGDPNIDYYDLKGTGGIIRSLVVGHRIESEQAVKAIGTFGIEPVIDEVFPFSRSSDALQKLIDAKHIGKIVIEVSD